MTEKLYVTAPLECKYIGNRGVFAGYASVFEITDQHRDVIKKGSFLKTLKQFDQITKIKLLWQHNASEPIGVLNLIYEDDYGLYVEARLMLDVQRAREAYSLLQAKAINGLSIGYYPMQYYHDPGQSVRVITEISLKEISLVTFPANEAATIAEIKNIASTAVNQIISLNQAIDYSLSALN